VYNFWRNRPFLINWNVLRIVRVIDSCLECAVLRMSNLLLNGYLVSPAGEVVKLKPQCKPLKISRMFPDSLSLINNLWKNLYMTSCDWKSVVDTVLNLDDLFPNHINKLLGPIPCTSSTRIRTNNWYTLIQMYTNRVWPKYLCQGLYYSLIHGHIHFKNVLLFIFLLNLRCFLNLQ